MIAAELATAVRRVQRAAGAGNPLLVGLDFDGVLAPIVSDRDAARALPGAVEAVQDLSRRPHTVVAVVSGRALADLAAVSRIVPGGGVTLIGSHGSEGALRQALGGLWASAGLTPETQSLLERVTQGLSDIATGTLGVDVEVKPSGAVLHTRKASADTADRVTARALAGPASWPGVHVTMGKSVVELSVLETSKGVALQRLRDLERAGSVVYVGDDVTDETVFTSLGPGDVGVKVARATAPRRTGSAGRRTCSSCSTCSAPTR